jgi:hypothetical protein
MEGEDVCGGGDGESERTDIREDRGNPVRGSRGKALEE